MARPKKETTEIITKQGAEIAPLSMNDSMELMNQIVLADFPDFDGNLLDKMSQRAVNYLYARFNGASHIQALMIGGVVPVEVEMWSKIPEFNSIMSTIKMAEASLAESHLWADVTSGQAQPLNLMFALKSRKSEYKENGAPAVQAVTNVRISIDGQDFDTAVSFKQLEGKEG